MLVDKAVWIVVVFTGKALGLSVELVTSCGDIELVTSFGASVELVRSQNNWETFSLFPGSSLLPCVSITFGVVCTPWVASFLNDLSPPKTFLSPSHSSLRFSKSG